MNKPSLNINKSLRQFYDSALNMDDESSEAAVVSELDAIKERYENEEKIAAGGMKVILKSHDKMTDRTVAKGVIRKKESHVTLEKFIEEARITASLEHPNIIPVYDLGLTQDKDPYFTMKMVEGDDLQQIIDRLKKKEEKATKFYDLDRMLEIFLKVCDAIEYAHSKNIVHLDIKPANIQVGLYGEVLVCDWGLARELKEGQVLEEEHGSDSTDSSIEMTMDGYIKGSPGFMAPEQISSEVALRTKKTDIYSLGCLLYSMLTLKSPINDGPLDEMLKQTLSGNIIETYKRCPDRNIPSSLSAVICKAMEVKPDDRYESVGDLSNEIRAYTRGFATQAENAGVFQLVSLLIKRHKALSLASSVFLILTIVLTTYFLVKVNKEKSVAVALNTELLEEQKERQSAARKASEYMLNNSIHNYYNRKFEETIPLALQAVELNENNTGAWRYLAYNYLGELRARDALEVLKHVDDEGGRFLTQKAKLLESLTKDGKVSVENVIEFRDHMAKSDPNFRKAISHHTNYTVTRTYSLEDRIKYAELSLSKRLNSEVKFRHLEKGLSLSVEDYKNKLRDIVVLEKLPIVSLNVSNSLLRDLSSMEHIPVEELDISNTELLNLKGLEKTKLKKINIAGSEVKGFHNLPKTVEVIIVGNKKLNLKFLNNYPNLKEILISKDSYSEKELQRFQLKAEIVFKD